VIALARTTGALEEVDDEIRSFGGKASLVPFDLTDGEGIERLAAALSERFGALDILVLNAATIGELAPVADIDPKVWVHTLNLNVTANWRLLRALDPMLRKSADARVVALTSKVGGEEARAFWGAYAVSKAALEMLIETHAAEMKNTTIRHAIIYPGAMRTDMRKVAMPGEDPMTLPHPDEIVPTFFEAITRKDREPLKLLRR